jgi:hypothetical protein
VFLERPFDHRLTAFHHDLAARHIEPAPLVDHIDRQQRAGEATLGDLLAHARVHDRRLDAIVGKRKAALITLLRKITDGLA